MTRTRLLALALAAASIFGPEFLAADQNQLPKEPVRIGAILPLSGPGAYIGQELRDGMRLAMLERQAESGRPPVLELLFEDSQSQPQHGVSIFHQMENLNKPLAYITALSSVSMALAPLALSKNVPLIGAVVTTPKFAMQNEWVFKYFASVEEEVKPFKPVLQSLAPADLGVVHVEDDFGRSVADLVESEYAAMGGKVVRESLPVGETDYRASLLRLKQRHVAGIYAVGYDVHLINIFRQVEEMKYTGKLLFSGSACSPSFRATKSADDRAIYTVMPLSYALDFEPARQFRALFLKNYRREPSHIAANGYDVVNWLAAVLDKGEAASSRLSLRQALFSNPPRVGVLGQTIVRAAGHEFSFPQPLAVIEGRDLRQHPAF